MDIRLNFNGLELVLYGSEKLAITGLLCYTQDR